MSSGAIHGSTDGWRIQSRSAYHAAFIFTYHSDILPTQCDAIVHWLRQAIYVDIEQPLAEALNFFLSVPVLISYGDVTVALQELTSWQKQIALNVDGSLQSELLGD